MRGARWAVPLLIILLTIYSPAELSRLIVLSDLSIEEKVFELNFIWFGYVAAMVSIAIMALRR